MTEQEKRERLEAKQHRRAKRAEKALKNRGIKNFLLWFLGFFMGLIIISSAIAVALTVIPIKTYMGAVSDEDPPVSENVWDKSLIEAILKMNTYQMSDVPILKGVLNDLMNGSGLGTIVTIDVNGEGFDDIRFVYEDGSKTFVGELQRYIKLAPTALGDDFAQLDVFKTMEVPLEDVPTPADMKGHNPKLYYYLASGSEAEGTAKYERAFTDDCNYTEGVNAQTKLYYLSISEMSLADVMDCVADRFGVTTVQSIIKCFGELPEDSPIAKILGDVTVGTIGNFSADEILIKDVLTDGEEFYDILADATGASKDEMTLGDLANIVPGDIKLTNILEDSDTLYSILEDATGVSKGELTVSDLEGLQTRNIKLTSVLSGADTLYDILVDATGVSKTNLTIGDLESLQTGSVKLQTVLTGADDLYKILGDATGKSASEITINDLSSIQTNNVKLSSVLDPNVSSNDTIYNILKDATGKEPSVMVVGDLSSLTVTNIKLSNVLDPSVSSNDTIYNILKDATGKSASNITVNDLSSLTVTDIKLANVLTPSSSELLYSILKDATGFDSSTITVGDLQGFTTTDIKLVTVMPKTDANAKLYSILTGATGLGEDAITIGSLSAMQPSSIKLNTVLTGGNSDKLLTVLADATNSSVENLTVGVIETSFEISNIKLSSLGITSTNNIINALLKDETVTVGNIGEKIDNLKVYDLFTVDCFTKNVDFSNTQVIYEKALNGDGHVEYTLYTGSGVPLPDNNLYYISNDSSLWLFMLYSYSGDGGDGLATKYTQKQTLYKNLESEFRIESQNMTNGTVRQFYDAGLLGNENDYSKIYTQTVKVIIQDAADALNQVG